MRERSLAVVFGAGSVGRGFLGQLFTESGFEVLFVDVDDVLVEALAARGSYILRLAGVVRTEELAIGPVRALHGSQEESVARGVVDADLLATAVGIRALPAIARSIARGLQLRWEVRQNSRPLNVIVCENAHDAPQRLRDAVVASLPEPLRPSVSEKVGFVPAVIARMSPMPTPEDRARDPSLIVAEPYKVLPVDREAFVGSIPQVVGMKPVAPFAPYRARKLFIHNAAHAILGYLGYRRGHTYGYEALEDPWIVERLNSALSESAAALTAEFHFEPVALQEHIDYLLVRFSNRALGDPVSRLARDPVRKLSPEDRLVGAARLAERHGIEPEGLAWGIAGALAYDAPHDSHAQMLQQRIQAEGLVRVLMDASGIGADERLGQLVLVRYAALCGDVAATVD